MNEKFSALMDGELLQRELSSVVGELVTSKDQQSAWYDWHASRDALQGQYALSPQFMTKFSARLASEPIVMAPHRLRKPHFGRQLLVPLSAAASVMFVGLAMWQFSSHPAAQPPANLAQLAAVHEIKSTEINPYLAIHRNGVANPMGGEQLAQVSFQVGEQH